MAYPPGLLKRTVQYGPILDSSGKPVRMKGLVHSDTAIYYAPSNATILNDPKPVESDGLGVISFEWPRSDQPFMTDGKGNPVTDFTSVLTVEFRSPGLPPLAEIPFLTPGGASPLILTSDLSVTRTAGAVVLPPSENTAQRAEQAAADAEAVLAAIQPGIAGGVAPLAAGTGLVLDAAGRPQSARNSTVWVATENGVVAGAGAPDQSANIQAALTALSAAGGGTLLFIGTFHIAGDGGLLITGADNVVMQGVYGAKIVKTGAGQLLMNWIGRKNWAIQGIDFDFGTKNYGSTGGGFDGWENSIRITDCQDFQVVDNVFRRGSFTLSLRNTSGGTNSLKGIASAEILRNRFLGTTLNVAVDILAPAASDTFARNILVQDNYVEAVSRVFLDGGKWTAFFINGGQNIKYLTNQVASSIDTGIMVNNTDHFEIRGNYLRTRQLCIYAGASRYGRIIGNDCSSEYDIGISLHAREAVGEPFEAGTIVSENIITLCGRSGITVEGTKRVTVTKNYIESCMMHITEELPATTTPAMVYFLPAGFGTQTLHNAGATTVYVGSSSAVTPGSGTPVLSGADYSYAPGTEVWLVTASGTGVLTVTAADNYKAAIGVWGIGANKPEYITITANIVLKGDSPESTTYAISVTDTPNYTVVADNNVGTGFAQRFRYGTMSARFQLQTDTGLVRTNFQLQLPLYSALFAPSPPLQGSFAYSPTYGPIWSDGTIWKKLDGTTVTP